MTYDPTRLSDLTADWNGHGSAAITSEAIETASQFQAVPLESGGIQVEVHARNLSVEIEISPTGDIDAVYSYRPEPEREETPER